MPKICLFCDNKAGNREHLWPQWMHAYKDFGPLKRDSYRSGRTIIPDPEITVKSVCAKCNNGWMSDLERISKPTIGGMFLDLWLPLDCAQQRMIAAWAIKTAIILDSIRQEGPGTRFYRKQDCIAMRETLAVPEHTMVWIGRIDSKRLFGKDTGLWQHHPSTLEPYVRSNVTTIVMGHFVVQSMTRRNFSKFVPLDMPVLQPKGENWEAYLTQVWPMEREWLTWPPIRSFTSGERDGIAYLLDRWRVGEKVDPFLLPDTPL